MAFSFVYIKINVSNQILNLLAALSHQTHEGQKKDLTNQEREQIALFRYVLIAPLFNNRVSSQKEYLAEICGKVHDVPYYGRKDFAPKTILGWLVVLSFFPTTLLLWVFLFYISSKDILSCVLILRANFADWSVNIAVLLCNVMDELLY